MTLKSYNDYRNGKPCAIIYDLLEKEEKQICSPVYAVDQDGKYAYTLDFYRLERLRPGYGYCNEKDKYENIELPTGFCLNRIDLLKNECVGIVTYERLFMLETKDSMIGAHHKINHIMINPEGTRIMFIHRWKKNENSYSRLLACDTNGEKLSIVSDEDFVSHCTWLDNERILGFVQKDNIKGYYIMDSYSGKYSRIWEELKVDGHPSVHYLSGVAITDTYPDRSRMASIFQIDRRGNISKIVECFSPMKYFAEFRCDLHPRFSRNGKKICFDSTHEGKRAMYVVELFNENRDNR